MKNYPTLDKWQELYSATLIQLPVAAAQLIFSGGRQRDDIEAAAWRAYESWLWLVNDAANRFYRAGALRQITPRGDNLRLVHSNPLAESILDSWPHAGRIEAR